MWMRDPILGTIFWSSVTIGCYYLARLVYRRVPNPWLSPLLTMPVGVLLIAMLLQAGYAEYSRSTHWLILMMGPATVAFAVPIYEQRTLIYRHWPALMLGVLVGSAISMATVFALGSWLGLSDVMRMSMMPRSTSTPFAMSIAGHLGGIPDLAAAFVAITGVCGAILGEVIIKFLPLQTSTARGALLGMGAHGAGVAKAHQVGREEGSVAGLVMVLAGLFNVLMAPLLAHVMI
ncbi:LrgB family protein [Xanthobacter sp. TB0136]|uniref:LrgB family protein n=1 Tax=Xanthobacter sp. TB0136 TaxID=3459177 RepID=UPI004039D1CC